jgi:hypothetical protein
MTLAERIGRWAPAIIGAYLIGKMVYAFELGAAQPADVLLAAAALLIMPPRRLIGFLVEERPLTLMLGWTALVGMAWAALRAQPQFLLAPLYLAFNVLAVAAVVGAREQELQRFDRIVTGFLFAAILIQFAAVLILPGHVNKDGVLREIGTFVTPNQLAYWAVCSMSLWLVLRRCRARPLDLLVLTLLSIVQVLSLSRAGMGATVVGLGVWAWFGLRPRVRYAAAALVVALAALAAVPAVRDPLEGSNFYAGLHQRVNKSDEHSSLKDRSVQRLIDYPQHLLLGAGEGDYARFTRAVPAQEVHSSLGTLLFGYGVVGLGLFLWLLWRIVATTPLRLSAQLLAPLVFSLAHNGLRFTFFWILVAVLIGIGRDQTRAVS